MKQTLMIDLRNKWTVFYNSIVRDERKNIVIYFPDLTYYNEPYSLQVINAEVKAKTKLARRMLKHLSEVGLI
jgi:hypothetical protein